MKVAIYSRKSKFTGHGESVENQVSMCRDYIIQQFGTIADKDIFIFEDEGFSGKNTNRPEFQRMMRMARSGVFDKLICYRLDRFSRDIRDFTTTLSELEQYHVDFICLREQFDTSSPMGRAMMYIASVFAQLERETIAQRIRDNMLELSKTGRWLGGCPPLGYSSQAIQDGSKTYYRLQPNDAEVPTVQLIFQLYARLRSLTLVERHLLLHGICTRQNKPFSRQSLRFLLSNPVYAPASAETRAYLESLGCGLFGSLSAYDGTSGLMGYNKTGKTDAVFLHYRDYSDWILAPGLHPPLVTTPLWITVQKLLCSSRSKSYRHPKNTVSLLSGLLTCASCGSYLRPKYGREDKNGVKRYYYLCEKKEKTKKELCSLPNLSGNIIDQDVLTLLCRLAKEYQLPSVSDTIPNKTVNPLDYTEKKRKENDRLIAQLSQNFTRVQSDAALAAITRQIDELDKENKNLCALQKSTPAETSELPGTFEQLLQTAPVPLQRMFLKQVIQSITWDGATVMIHL